MTSKYPALCVLLAVTMVGCSGPLTKIAPRPTSGATMTREGKGSACGVNLFGLIPIGVNDRAERAYQQALTNAGASGLTETTVTDRWYYIYVGMMVCTDIAGSGFRETGS